MRKIEDYWYFDMKKFIRDHPGHVADLKDLRDALSELTETKAQNYDAPPGTPGRGDCVPAAAEQADLIKSKIQRILPLVDLYNTAEKVLTEEEKEIIKYLFHRPGLHTSNVAYIARSRHMDTSTVYRKSNAAIEKMAKAIGVKWK